MTATWQDVNQRYLTRQLNRVYAAIVPPAQPGPTRAVPRRLRASRPSRLGAPAALQRLGETLKLTPFEEDVLLLCAGVELEARFAAACASAHENPRMPWPTFGLALSTLSDPHWSAMSRDRPLRYWRLVDIGGGDGLLRSPVRIDERILHYLTGVSCSDERLEPFVRLSPPAAGGLPGAHAACAREVARCWTHLSAHTGGPAAVLLIGRHAADQAAVAQEACRLTGLHSFVAPASDLPPGAAEREQLARAWNREALLVGAGLHVAVREWDGGDDGRTLRAFLDLLRVPVTVEVREGSPLEQTDGHRIHVAPLQRPERKALWIERLGPVAAELNGGLDRIVDHFRFDAASIGLASAVIKDAAARGAADPQRLTWNVCRLHARRSLEHLAVRIDPKAGWPDLIVPAVQLETLRQIVAHVRQRARVQEEWGFGRRYARGLGVTALLAGASGTGKTMAAEVMAGELEMDLFQIDLASVVSKYIGETEKNLRRLFDAAEESGAVLLFDEADALFGKRTEVRDSHDRYANVEISYLLQRMESYRGLALLTSNMRHAMDSAFLRRIRFIVQFPLPDRAQRHKIWARVFPAETPTDGLNFDRLAQLNISGGVIRNIATHAAFLAADEGAPVGMAHLLRACRVEYAKLEKPLTAPEVAGWA